MVGLVVTLLACTASVAGARITYTTSKPAMSNAPKKDRPFVTSGYITPKSTASNRATVKIILWMKYGTAGASWTRTGRSCRARPAGEHQVLGHHHHPHEGRPRGAGGAVPQGQEGVQVGDQVLLRPAVSRLPEQGQERVTRTAVVPPRRAPARGRGRGGRAGDRAGHQGPDGRRRPARSVGSATASGSPVAVASPTGRAADAARAAGWTRARPLPRSPARPTCMDGVQVLNVGLVGGYYRPNRFTVQAGVPVKVVFTG